MNKYVIRKSLVSGVMFSLNIWATPTLVFAAEAVNDPELIKLQTEKSLAEARQAVAEANLAAEKAKLGEIKTELPKGTFAATNLNIEGQILAYRAASDAADIIANSVANFFGKSVDGVGETPPNPISRQPSKSVIFFSSKEMNNLTAYQSFKVQSDLFETQMQFLAKKPDLLSDKNPSLCPRPTTEAPQAAPVPQPSEMPPLLALDTALQLLGIFKTDKTITGSDVTLNDFAIHSIVASKLINQGIEVVYPPSYFPATIRPAKTTDVYVYFDKLVKHRHDLEKRAAEVDVWKQELSNLTAKNPKCKEVYASDVATLNSRKSYIATTQTALNQVITSLTSIDSQTGQSQIQALAVAALISENYPNSTVLQVKPVVAGGETMTSKNIFRTKLSFSGGAVLTYMLMNNSGAVVRAGTIPIYGGFVDMEEMK